MGPSFTRLFHPTDLPRIRAHFQAIAHAEDNEVLEVEYRFRKKNGDWIWCVSRDTVFERDEQGAVRRFIGSFFDVTDRKRAEIALRESEHRVHSILHNLPVPIIVSEGEFQNVLSLNRQFVEVFGYAHEEIPDIWHW
jgi:PAS domain-containing protein